MPNSLSKWFSSPRSGAANNTSTATRRRRESIDDPDDSINGGGGSSTSAMTRQQLNYEPPPMKRARVLGGGGAITNGLKKKPVPFNYTTTTTTTNTSSGYTFGRSNDDGSGSDTSDTDIYDGVLPSSTTSTTTTNARQLNIAPLDSMSSSSSAQRRSMYEIDSPQQQRFARQFPPTSTPRNVAPPPSDDGQLQNESAESESGESSASVTKRTIGAGQHQPPQPSRLLNGLFATSSGSAASGAKRSRTDADGDPSSSSGVLSFTARLQTQKSLFSDKNMRSSLSNLTTSLTSLNRRRPSSLSASSSMYGSTSALSDSRLLNTNSPFYCGRTMYGGAAAAAASSAYSSRRAASAQRTLRVPTQIRPASSLSTLSTSTNSLAAAATSAANADQGSTNPALSNTAKRILELMEQFKSPLEDARKMSARGGSGQLNESTVPIPALVERLRRFDDFDKMKNRSGGIRLSQPRTTPYSRDVAKRSPPPPTHHLPPLCGAATELQVPSMSQLLQMKKVLQSKTEKVRELAAASQSHLNQSTDDAAVAAYTLPSTASNDKSTDKLQTAAAAAASSRKMRNKINNNRPGSAAAAKQLDESPAEPANLPNIQLNMSKSAMPIIDIDISVPPSSKNCFTTATNTNKKTRNSIVVATTPATPPPPTSIKTKDFLNNNNELFAFSSPLLINKPSFAIAPTSASNNFNFSEPLDKFNGSCSPIILPKRKEHVDGAVKSVAVTAPVKPLLKNGSVLDALKKAPADPPAAAAAAQLPSLSAMFKTNKTDQWECSLCMVRNDRSKTKCVACESPNSSSAAAPPPAAPPQTILPPITNSFGIQFKAAASTWECDACMIRNKSEATKCVACETPKTGAAPIAPTTNYTTLPAVITTDDGFKSLVAKQSAKWECAACMTRNDAQRKKCECCELEKPGGSGAAAGGKLSASSSSFSFGNSSSAATKFNFGVPFNSSAPAVQPIVVATTTTAAPKTFSFGVPAVSLAATTTTSTPKPAATGFSFGSSATTTETSSSVKTIGL